MQPRKATLTEASRSYPTAEGYGYAHSTGVPCHGLFSPKGSVMSKYRYISDRERHNELSRALQICRLLAFRTLTLYQLAEELHCSPRTIRRAIYALTDAGIDILKGRDALEFDLEFEDRPGLTRTAHPGWKAMAYRLDRRAWSGLLYLPDDGQPARREMAGAA